MTPEQLDKARAKEAGGDPVKAARLARENWTPPEPVVDPDVLAWREWVSRQHPLLLPHNVDFSHLKNAYLAGARMARAQEQERAKVLVAGLEDISYWAGNSQISKMTSATLAKYRGEA